METLKKIQMVKITPFKYIVINKITSSVTHIMMGINKDDISNIESVIQYNTDKIKESKGKNVALAVLELNDFIISTSDIVMYGETYSDLPKVEQLINTITVGDLNAPGHINPKTLEVSLEMVVGCTTARFYKYYCTLIGNPKYIIIFKHYGSLN